jgi:signal transduction histidine kinase
LVRCGISRNGGGPALCYRRDMALATWRDRAALAVATLAFALGLWPLTLGHFDPGIGVGVDEAAGRLVVTSVDPYGPAARDGVQPGMVVVRFNDVALIALPQPVYGPVEPSAPDGDQKLIRADPPAPLNLLPPSVLSTFVGTSIQGMELIQPWDLASGSAEAGFPTTGVFYPGWYEVPEAGFFLLPGLAILLVGAWWLATGRAGESLRPLALPLATAVATPFLVMPLLVSGNPIAMILGEGLRIAAVIPLGVGLAERVEAPLDRRFALAAVGLFAIAGVVVAVAAVVQPITRQVPFPYLLWGLTGLMTFVPGVIAAGPQDVRSAPAGDGSVRSGGAGRLLRSTELALAGATPFFAQFVESSYNFWPLLLWLCALAVAGRFTVRPLARLATRATLQRDLVVAATEAERARLAADIHDDALQELTLLVRRLEGAGDAEGAEIGRTVADKLRAICGDLRLPILDDLGVGPALDWLVLRIERLAGGEVRLERSDDARHHPDVELAIFRVAQEALANAVKHGRPPIIVRYRSTPSGISLAIDDAGPGIADDAPEAAEQTGRFGLLNMAQRAEQIGAILDVKRWPGGGTHVALEWRPH